MDGGPGRLTGGGRDALIALFAASYTLLVVSAVSTPAPTALLVLALGGLQVALAGAGFVLFEAQPWPPASYVYFAVQLTLGAAVFLVSHAEGGESAGVLSLLLVAAQSVWLLPGRAAAPVCATVGLALVTVGALMAPSAGGLAATREVVFLLVALTFTVAISHIAVRERRARRELDAATRSLRLYAAQTEELATARERNRLAREVHDGLGQYLTTINIQLQAARAVLDGAYPRVERTLAKAQELSHEALLDVRRSVAALHSAPGQGKPLLRALQDLADESSAGGVSTRLTLAGEPRPLSPQVEHTLYRAAQESLTNTRKHARATRAQIELDYRAPNVVRLDVRDDGQGAGAAESGFGLAGLRERAKLVGGEMVMHTSPGNGFRVSVEAPG
jgi:signal transduction histidine kinase